MLDEGEFPVRAAFALAAAGVILGWLFLQYGLDVLASSRHLWTAETSLLVFLCFVLFSVFVYVIVKATGRRY